MFRYKVRKLKSKTREQIWKSFFDEEPAGQQIQASREERRREERKEERRGDERRGEERNPAWTTEQVAAEISGIYRFICKGVYSPPNGMYNDNTNRYTAVGQPKEKAKIISLLFCIASAMKSLQPRGMLPLLEA